MADREADIRTRRRRFALAAIGLGLVGALLLAEVIARLMGEKPFHAAKLVWNQQPEQSIFVALPDGGYRHSSGRVRIDIVPEFGWTMTHDDDGLRITGTNATPGRDQLWFMGCSLTQGWSCSDDETYPWRVQQSLTNYSVVNGGTSGYGTIHSRLMFQDLLVKRGKPKIVVYAYGRFHDYRNTFVRTWQKGFIPNNRLPKLTLPVASFVEGQLEYSSVAAGYREWPLQRVSALVHALERRYNFRQAQASRSHEVSRELIAQWAAFCLKEEIRFVVAGISSDAGPMLEWCEGLKIETVDIALPLSGKEYTNLPYDNHPNAKAHAVYSERLVKFLIEK